MKAVTRKTKETEVRVEAAIGEGKAAVHTTVPFLDHMLTALATYSGLDLTVTATGDLRHHLIEDVAITMGEAVRAVIPATCRRYGERTVPMDDALVQVVLDAGGRPYYRGPCPTRSTTTGCAPLPTTPGSRCTSGRCAGQDRHHVVEAAFKALGFALRDALADGGKVFSTKGTVSLRSE